MTPLTTPPQDSTEVTFAWDPSLKDEKITSMSFVPRPDGFLPFKKALEAPYRALPWPDCMKKITFFTEVKGGFGDIVAAGRVIDLAQKMAPETNIDWQFTGCYVNPSKFLYYTDPSRIEMFWKSRRVEPIETHFLITGPTDTGWGMNYIAAKINTKVAGPRFTFLECAEMSDSILFTSLLTSKSKNSKKRFHNIFAGLAIVPSSNAHLLGLEPGSGLLLDSERVNAALSRKGCCPSYLARIQDKDLLTDLAIALKFHPGKTLPDFDKFSLNFGYAHYSESWARFIDSVATQTQTKNVVIVLNTRSTLEKFHEMEFKETIFTKERLRMLQELGYGIVHLKRKNEPGKAILLESPKENRSLEVILREGFLPEDVKWLQLAAEGLLTTGDNSFTEAIAARCTYLQYEVANPIYSCKSNFQKQIIAQANDLYAPLGKLLAINGESCSLSQEDEEARRNLLRDPLMRSATLMFCEKITQEHDARPLLEAAIKRVAWTYLIPELFALEREHIDPESQKELCAFFEGVDSPPRKVAVSNLTQLAQEIQAKVQDYMESKKNN